MNAWTGTANRGTSNLIRVSRKKSWWIGFSEDDVYRRRPISFGAAFLHISRHGRTSQRVEDNAFHLWGAPHRLRDLRLRPQCHHFPQHAQATSEKANLAPLSVIQTARTFANPKA